MTAREKVAIAELCPMCRDEFPLTHTPAGWFHDCKVPRDLDEMGFSWPYVCRAYAVHDVAPSVSEGQRLPIDRPDEPQGEPLTTEELAELRYIDETHNVHLQSIARYRELRFKQTGNAYYSPLPTAPQPEAKGESDDAEVMRIWRECGLPEYFLGNGGTNHKLVEFAERYAKRNGRKG